MANFISDEEVAPRHIQKQQEGQINYEAIIKFESNKQLLEKVEDEGDCLSLLGRHNDAIGYYDAIFAQCKTEMGDDVLLLSSFQNKKGLNYELGKSSQTALQYFYNAYNFIRKSKRYSQIELNVIKCLEGAQDYQKMVAFGETLVDIAIKHKFIE
jgi:tetratricopeptide (TPR) repeat protein